MAVKIRLQRGGRKKLPQYVLVVADSRSPRDGKYIMKLGFYHPLEVEDKQIVINEESIKYWLAQGAQPTNTVTRLLIKKGIMRIE